MKLIQGKYRYASAHDMYELLGVKELPAEGMPERLIQGVRIYVKPLEHQVMQTSCYYCGLDIEGFSPYKPGTWRDRGNNTRCPILEQPFANSGRHHKPNGKPGRNWQGLRVIAICDCGKHVPVGRMHQHKCSK